MKNRLNSRILQLGRYFAPFLKKLLPTALKKLIWRFRDRSINATMKDPGIVPFQRGKHPDGINLIGYACAEVGLGESCRILANILEHSALSFTLFNVPSSSSCNGDLSRSSDISQTTPYNINLIHINPPELPMVYLDMGKEHWDTRYNIGFWLWELEDFPDNWTNRFSLVDEIWAPSSFIADSIRSKTALPVHTLPYAIDVQVDQATMRASFGLPENMFLFLVMGDGNSILDRKNPMGAIEAFKLAFPCEKREIGLVVKITSAHQEVIADYQHALEGYCNVFFLTEVLEKKQLNALISLCDVFISLHRSEGFGLVLAEAMFLGTPTIATNWSANTEFSDDSSACLVDFTFITLKKTIGPYATGNRWADPDTKQAADFMKKLSSDRTFYNGIAENGKRMVRQLLSAERASTILEQRISEIYTS